MTRRSDGVCRRLGMVVLAVKPPAAFSFFRFADFLLVVEHPTMYFRIFADCITGREIPGVFVSTDRIARVKSARRLIRLNILVVKPPQCFFTL